MTPADELNIEDRAALQRYLQSNFAPAAEFEIVEFEILAGGVSGRTVRVKLSGGQAWVLKQALAKLRVKADWFSDPRRIHREALGMKVLGELTPPGSIPKLIFDDETHHVLGMETVPQPHENWKTMLLAGDWNEKYVKQFGKLLGAIHRESTKRRDRLEKTFEDRQFFEALRIEPYYEYSAQQEPRAAAFLRQLVDETRSRSDALVHGDYSPKNILIHDRRLILLDHEVIHWGDPAFDVGFAVSHLIGKGHYSMPSYSYGSTSPNTAERMSSYTASLIFQFWKYYRSEIYDVPWLEGYEQRCIRHALACTLARAIGRSPFEYLDQIKRAGQRETILLLLSRQLEDLHEMAFAFFFELNLHIPSSGEQ